MNHAKHDHGHHGHCCHGQHDAAAAQATDPVCGMEVDPQKAAGASVHQGKTYYFCSGSCRDKFEQAPAKYLGSPDQDERKTKGTTLAKLFSIFHGK